ncbi:hypothetical protein F2Q69_00039979 [Brassica cretica]|uniref:Uncharacterized protein n=1 Tax=Brassica cretica TaxID=69181 RepID=A0A8S9NG05_BRACR|nr:hypothetical protein F2Q69_00039979 [Brassica cretica]
MEELEYNKEKNVFDRVHQETFGKSGDVACLDIAPVPEGRQRSPFLAVGSYDIIITVRILSLDPDDRLQILMFERNHGSSEFIVISCVLPRSPLPLTSFGFETEYGLGE